MKEDPESTSQLFLACLHFRRQIVNDELGGPMQFVKVVHLCD